MHTRTHAQTHAPAHAQTSIARARIALMRTRMHAPAHAQAHACARAHCTQVRTVTMGGGFDMHSMAWDEFTRADFVHAF